MARRQLLDWHGRDVGPPSRAMWRKATQLLNQPQQQQQFAKKSPPPEKSEEELQQHFRTLLRALFSLDERLTGIYFLKNASAPWNS